MTMVIKTLALLLTFTACPWISLCHGFRVPRSLNGLTSKSHLLLLHHPVLSYQDQASATSDKLHGEKVDEKISFTDIYCMNAQDLFDMFDTDSDSSRTLDIDELQNLASKLFPESTWKEKDHVIELLLDMDMNQNELKCKCG